MKYATIRILRKTHRLISRISDEEQRNISGTVDVAMSWYDEYRKQLESYVDSVEFAPKKR